MERKLWRDHRGQVLVQVALGLLVLLLVVGLAIDGGNVYAQRRAMQNAADAGALAGARAICAGNPGDADGIAIHYAEELNGADEAVVDPINPADGIVRVTARKEADTFLMGLAGFDTVDVAADAAAQCGLADAVGGVWPIAFDYPTYKDIIGCGDQFLVWVDDNEDVQDLYEEDGLCTVCDCEDLKAYGGAPFAPGDRGWLRLAAPPDPDPDFGVNDCGANALRTWLEHGYSGLIEVGDCVPTESGVTASALKVIENITGTILLFDQTPCALEDGSCPGDPKHVAGFGCVEVLEVDTNFTLDPLVKGEKRCPKNEKVIRVKKLCPCDMSSSGKTGGETVGPGGVPAVSLIE